ncbi:MAG: hypothetical protein WCJ29_03975 [bacterium]
MRILLLIFGAFAAFGCDTGEYLGRVPDSSVPYVTPIVSVGVDAAVSAHDAGYLNRPDATVYVPDANRTDTALPHIMCHDAGQADVAHPDSNSRDAMRPDADARDAAVPNRPDAGQADTAIVSPDASVLITDSNCVGANGGYTQMARNPNAVFGISHLEMHDAIGMTWFKVVACRHLRVISSGYVLEAPAEVAQSPQLVDNTGFFLSDETPVFLDPRTVIESDHGPAFNHVSQNLFFAEVSDSSAEVVAPISVMTPYELWLESGEAVGFYNYVIPGRVADGNAFETNFSFRPFFVFEDDSGNQFRSNRLAGDPASIIVSYGGDRIPDAGQ